MFTNQEVLLLSPIYSPLQTLALFLSYAAPLSLLAFMVVLHFASHTQLYALSMESITLP